jgi:signal transduction histidine kinase/CheY-like chemotaxis protein
MTAGGRRRGTIFTRVLSVVVIAGLVPLLMAAAAATLLVTEDKEAALVDGALAAAETRGRAVESRIALARAELRTVALAARQGELLVVPELVSDPMVAVRCVRGDTDLVDAATDVDVAERLRRAVQNGGTGTTLLGDGWLLVHERAGDIDAWGLLDPTSLLAVPHGWKAELRGPAGVDMVAYGDAAGALAAESGGAVARRESLGGVQSVTVVAPTSAGPSVVLRAPITPAREAAFELVRDVAGWSLLAVLPLVLIGVLLARAVTSPVRGLARAVREARDGPVRPPPLSADEIGDLGEAIAGMSEHLHEDARVLRRAALFSRELGALRDRRAVLDALERTLGEAFPGCDWRVQEDGREGAEGDEADAVLAVPLAAEGALYGRAVAAGRLDEIGVRMAELLCRTAVAAMSNVELRDAAVVNEKLALLGRLAASVAHEMNNPLAFVSANLKMLEESLDGELRAMASDASDGAERLRRIVDDLSSIAKGGAQRTREPHDLCDIARMAVKIASARRVTARIRLDAPHEAIVACDRGRIEQAALNLIINAADACEGLAETEVSVRVGRAAACAWLEVSDGGPGIRPEVQQRIFEPFFTTKGEAGTGLGLFLSRSFVQTHRGDLELVSSGPHGTTFRMSLPIAPLQRSFREGEPAPAGAKQAERRRLLVLDDEPAIVRAMVRWLGRRAETIGTTDPDEALALAASERFDLILCDLHMPRMSGSDFVNALRERRPDAADRVVIMTGSGETGLAVPVLRKPIPAEKIDELFDAL